MTSLDGGAVENAGGLELNMADDVVTLINVFTPHEGQTDAFCQTQIGEYQRLSGKVEGTIATNLHRSIDGKHAINYAQFANKELYDAWVSGALFSDHLAIVKPFIAKVEPKIYKLLFTSTSDWDRSGPEPRFRGFSEERGAVVGRGRVGMTLVNVLTPKPSKVDELCEVQIAEARRLRPLLPQVVSTNMLRSLDGEKVALYTQFVSAEGLNLWLGSAFFAEHRERIQQYAASAQPIPCEVVFTLYQAGARVVP